MDAIATTTGRKPLRVWPGVVLGALFFLVRLGLPLIRPDFNVYGVLGGLVISLAILLWWLLFSRAPWLDPLKEIRARLLDYQYVTS
jgi:hypothetical protein